METPREATPLVAGNLQNQPIYESTESAGMPLSRRERHSDKILAKRPSFNSKKHKENMKSRRRWPINRKRISKRKGSEEAFIHITGTGTILEDSLDNINRTEAWSKYNSVESDLDELRPGLGPYEDFHTIDWQKDFARDRNRHRYIVKKMQETKCNFLKGYYDALSGWICVFVIGVIAGCVADLIDVGEGWMKDLKDGVCLEAFYLNKEQCCWSSNQTYFEGDKCDEWRQWHEFIPTKLTETEIYLTSYATYVTWSLFFGVLTGCMVKTLAPYACGSGIPEIKTILSGFIMRGYLGKMTLLVKSVGMIMAVSAGLRLGKEGPMVHAACCIGNIVCYLFPKYGKNEAKKREMLSAASAAGIAIAFNAPIGGVLFSLEEVSYYFPLKTMWRSFFCALVAAFVLGSLNPYGTEHPIKFYLNSKKGWIFVELIPFIMLGVFGGIIGAAFNRCNVAWCSFRRTSKLGAYPITEVLVVTVLSALVNFPNIFTKLNGSDLIRLLFTKCSKYEASLLCDYNGHMTFTENRTIIFEHEPGFQVSLYLLGLTLITIWVSTIFTFGIKVPSGLFVPSMAMGAVMGRIVGIGMQRLAKTFKDFRLLHSTCVLDEGCLAPELYAMIGAAACLGGVTRMTVSLVVIMFELTGGINYIMPLMATIVTSKWVGDALYKNGIYDAHILLNKYPFLNNKDEIRTTSLAIDLTRNKRSTEEPLYCIQKGGMTLETIENIMTNTTHIGFPVVTSYQEQSNLVGFVLRRDLKLAIKFLKKTKDGINKDSKVYFTKEPSGIDTVPMPIFLAKILDVAPITVTVETPMETIIDMFRKLGLRHILITENGKLVDIITKKDILRHMHEASVV